MQTIWSQNLKNHIYSFSSFSFLIFSFFIPKVVHTTKENSCCGHVGSFIMVPLNTNIMLYDISSCLGSYETMNFIKGDSIYWHFLDCTCMKNLWLCFVLQTFVFLIFWYQLYCGFSGSVMIDQMYLMLYNLLFTSLPPLAIGKYRSVLEVYLLLT